MLGIRFNARLEFTPQINHILAKLDWHTSNIYRLNNLGLKNHILKVLFSVCFGSFNYGLGLMPYWGKEKYNEAQVKINRAIRNICDLKLKDGKHVPQRILLSLVNILPFHLQHQRMALLLLNRVMKNKKPKDLYDIILDHLEQPDGWFAGAIRKPQHDMNGEGPMIKLNNPKILNANQAVIKRVFPLSCKDWFNNLPWEIRFELGKKKFDHMILNHLQQKCFHPIKKDPEKCSVCRNQVNFDNIDLEVLIQNLQFEYDQNITCSHKYDDQIISLSTYINCILLKINNENDIIVEDDNWSEESRSFDYAY